MNRIYTHIIIAFAFCTACAAAYVFAYMEVGAVGYRIAEIDAQIAAKNEELKQIQEARTALNVFSEKEARIKAYFLPKSEVVPFMEEIGRTGAMLGSRVDVLGVAEEEADGRGSVELTLRIEGTFEAVMRTIGALEFAPYDIALTRLSIDAVSQETTGALWAAQASYVVGTQTP